LFNITIYTEIKQIRTKSTKDKESILTRLLFIIYFRGLVFAGRFFISAEVGFSALKPACI
jgi:hypothetical protein